MPDDIVDETRITIKLSPKASCNAITHWHTDEKNNPILKVNVTAVPENGKANAALIKLLSKELKLPKSSISIIQGEKCRTKTVSLRKMDYSALKNCFPEK